MISVLDAAQSAYGRVPFYELLYRTPPMDLAAVPFILSTHYHRATGSVECIDSSIEVCGVLPPFMRGSRRFPFSVLESDADIDQRQERLDLALKDVGILPETHQRMLIVSSEVTGPFAADLSTGLGWEGHPASIFYWNGDRAELAFQIEAHRPDYVIWLLACDPLERVDFDAAKIIVAHSIDEPLPEWTGPLFLFGDETSLIGSRPAGRTAILIDQSQFAVETGPAGHPSLTTLTREAFPLIRYELAHSFEVLR